MNLTKAINLLKNYPPGASPDHSIEFTQAILLGIEAMEYQKHLKDEGIIMPDFLLPSETKE